MQDYLDYFKVIIFFGLLGGVMAWIAKANGFFVPSSL